MSRHDDSTRNNAPVDNRAVNSGEVKAVSGFAPGIGDASDDAMVCTTLTLQVPTLIYDGECGFCRRCADWLRARRSPPQIVDYQSAPLATWGVSREDCERAVQWLGSEHCEGARAIAAALSHCGAPWSWAGRLIAAPGLRRISDRVYRRVASRRRCHTTPPIA
jgi:predicted DCC family thiol-disulfide oxidoreductase YuxK